MLEKEEDETAKQLQELKEMVTNVLQRFREEVSHCRFILLP